MLIFICFKDNDILNLFSLSKKILDEDIHQMRLLGNANYALSVLSSLSLISWSTHNPISCECLISLTSDPFLLQTQEIIDKFCYYNH